MCMRCLLIFVLIVLFGNVFSQSIQIVNGISPTVLVQDTFINGCVNATNIQFTGESIQISYFNKASSNFPFKSGILLTTGDYNEALGPNNQTGAGTSLSPGPGDSNLNAIATGSTNDAAVLQFDFTPSSDTINFRYIFASEEYDEYVNTSYNDIFAFFLTGPNPAGGNYTNKNIALIPGTTTPVSINNVNNGNTSSGAPTGPCENCAYYHNNYGGQAVEYDGYTVALTATALVVPCQTYHIKLAVADVADHALDSGVFLEAGSFTSGGQVAMNNFSQVGDENSLYEGCTNFYVFSRIDSTDLTDSVEVLLSYSGTATQGVDISYFPTSFWIPVGQIYDTIYYEAYYDGIQDGDETIILTLLSGCPCNMNAITDTINIYDLEGIKGGIQNVTNQFCSQAAPDSILIYANVSLSNPTYVWNTGEVSDSIYVSPIPGKTWYYVTISDVCGNSIYDSIPIIVGTFSGINVDVVQPQCNNVCNGSITVTTVSGNPPFTYEWYPSGTSLNGSATDLCLGMYKVTVTDSLGCTHKLPSTIFLTNPAPLSSSSYINNTSLKYCDGTGTNISLTTTSQVSSIQYLWNTNETTSSIVVNPSNGSSTYWVKFQDICGNTFTDSITLKSSDMSAPNITSTNVLCYNTCTGTVNVSPNGGASPYVYQWNPSGIGATNSGIINTLCNGSFNVTITDAAGCSKNASFSITTPTDIVSAVNTTNSTCYNSCDGTAIVSISGGTSPYSYIWNPSNIGTSDSGNVSSLCKGNYSVTILDANNCSKTKTFSTSEPSEILLTTNVLALDSVNLCVGSASVSATGGVSPYSYLWSNADNSKTQQVDNLCAGTYTITVTDANDCKNTTTVTIF